MRSQSTSELINPMAARHELGGRSDDSWSTGGKLSAPGAGPVVEVIRRKISERDCIWQRRFVRDLDQLLATRARRSLQPLNTATCRQRRH